MIYGLHDPVTDELRYVGKTRWPANKRMNGHRKRARLNTKTPLYDWWRSLNNEPVLKPIHTDLPVEITEDEVEVSEIEYRKDLGYRLLNLTPGGDGGSTGWNAGFSGRSHTDATKRRIGAASSAYWKGRKKTPQHVINMKKRYKNPEQKVCKQCGRKFRGAHGLSVHVGRSH